MRKLIIASNRSIDIIRKKLTYMIFILIVDNKVKLLIRSHKRT